MAYRGRRRVEARTKNIIKKIFQAKKEFLSVLLRFFRAKKIF